MQVRWAGGSGLRARLWTGTLAGIKAGTLAGVVAGAVAGMVTLGTAPSARAEGAEPSELGPAPLVLENEGFPAAYYYKPRSGRAMKPVLVYLHGRGNNPEESCRQWARVATEFGWLLCPAGQEDRGPGSRGWGNDYVASTRNVMGALQSLRKKYKRRVQLYGNVLIGFSEGAYIAQNIGQREVKTFNRWLILASCDRYFGYDASILEEARHKIKRVYLWTGEMDGVVAESEATFAHLQRLGVNVRLNIPKGYWHAIPVDTMAQNFRKVLRWLVVAK